MRRTRLVFLAVACITGCAGLIGVPDLTLDEQAVQGNPDGAVADGASFDGSTSEDAGPPCDLAAVATDPLNCGRCGHDCVGGACTDGVCQPVSLAEVGGAPLYNLVEHGNDLYVSTNITLTTQAGGIWKLSKTTGTPVPYVTLRYAERMAIVGETLYFVVNDTAFDDAGTEGGLWSCDLTGPTPCVPKLVTVAESPAALAADQGKIIFNDATSGKGLLRYVPPGPPSVFRVDYNPSTIWVDNEAAFYVVSLFSGGTDRGVLYSIPTDAGDPDELSRYAKPNANGGRLVGTASALYFTAFDFNTTNGGVVRRVARPGAAGVLPCDYAGTTNVRPHGIYIDDKRVYWTNRGEPGQPYTNAAIASCALDGCCTTADKHWSGAGEPVALTGDSKAIYWATYRTGQVWKTAKP